MSDIENVVVVVVDALRADRVGCLGSDRELTPNIDAVAANGTAFDNAFTCATNTDPSVTSIFTGRYPLETVYHHGKLVTDDEKRRIESVTSLPELLSNAGWRTASMGQSLGRWHDRGFDRYPTTDHEAGAMDDVMGALKRLFTLVDERAPAAGSAVRSAYDAVSGSDGDADEMKPRVVQEDYDPTELLSMVDSGPFFGWAHLMETHMPYLGRTDDFDRLWETYDYPAESTSEFFKGRDVTAEQRERIESGLRYLGLDRPGELVALYDAAVRYADRKIGELVDELRAEGLWDETALFVISDHGESLLEHGIFIDHHGLYDEVFRVPVVSSLGTGENISELVQLTDLAPTIVDLVGIEADVPMDGDTLLPLIEATDGWESREYVFAEEAYTERRFAVRSDTWALIEHTSDETIENERGSSLKCGYCETVHGSEVELYNTTDRNAERNRLESEPDVVETFEAAYDEFVRGLVRADGVDSRINYEDEDEVLDRLRAIGYK